MNYYIKCPFCDLEMALCIYQALQAELKLNPNLDIIDYSIDNNQDIDFACKNFHFITFSKFAVVLTYKLEHSYLKYQEGYQNIWYCKVGNLFIKTNEANPLDYFYGLLLLS